MNLTINSSKYPFRYHLTDIETLPLEHAKDNSGDMILPLQFDYAFEAYGDIPTDFPIDIDYQKDLEYTLSGVILEAIRNQTKETLDETTTT